MDGNSWLIVIIVGVLNSALITAIIDYRRNKRKLPHEVDSMVASRANTELGYMSNINQTLNNTISDLRAQKGETNKALLTIIKDLHEHAKKCPEIIPSVDMLREIL